MNIYEHLQNRTRLAYGAAAELFNNNEFEKKTISGLVKIQQFKTYIRSILLFGIENYELNQSNLDIIRKTEIGIIKGTLGIWNRTKNTLFLAAARIQETSSRIELSKTNFMIRALNHPYTGEFIHNILTESNGEFHHNSVLNKLEINQDQITRLHFKARNIEKLSKQTQLETENQSQLRYLLEDCVANKERIYNLLQAF